MSIRATKILVSAFVLMISGLAFSQTQVPNTFQAGQPARATEVNDNFAAIEAAVNDNATGSAGKATKDQTSYSLNGRALSRYSPEELNAWRASLRVEVREERAKLRRESGGKPHTNVKARFSSAI